MFQWNPKYLKLIRIIHSLAHLIIFISKKQLLLTENVLIFYSQSCTIDWNPCKFPKTSTVFFFRWIYFYWFPWIVLFHRLCIFVSFLLWAWNHVIKIDQCGESFCISSILDIELFILYSHLIKWVILLC